MSHRTTIQLLPPRPIKPVTEETVRVLENAGMVEAAEIARKLIAKQ